ncbi:MAG: putative internalin [Solirubrobacterales bacterium]|nr:putative internalin [Solirubrobacterales bacterium]
MAVRRTLAVALVATAALAIGAPAASATFHLMSIREVYPGSVANPGSEYVELQMWAEDQNHVGGHVLRTYDGAGAVTGSDVFAADVPHGANQSTMVLGTPEAEAEFGFLADTAMSPSGLDPSGGAVCWESIDCVAWGSFSGFLPSPAGPAAAAIPDGMALRRSIAPGCASLLEPTDDHDSGADFSPAFPSPRPNSTPPSERACAGAGLGGGAGSGPAAPGRGAPGTALERKPAKRSHDRSPTFRFGSDEAGASFECRVDKRPFRPCVSPFTARALGLGRHSFRVRARDDSGQADPSPAAYSFVVLSRR